VLQRVDDPKIIERMRAIAAERPRFGWRRIHVLLQRESVILNHRNCAASIAQSNCRHAPAANATYGTSAARPW